MKRKTKRVACFIIAIILIVAMVLPLVISMA